MKKKILAHLEKCYSIAPLTYQGKRHILVASEVNNRCLLFDAEGNKKATIWEGPGGTMSMVQVPGTDGQFLATHQFYSPNNSKEAKIVVVTPDKKGNWHINTLTDLPFVHRFDILTCGGKNYLIACALKSDHHFEDDWSSPGKVYVAELPEDLTSFDEEHPLPLTILTENLLKNHGYAKVTENGKESSLVCSENGILRIFPPTENTEWKVEPLLNVPSSDAVLLDLDGDGEKELVILAPFHGDQIKIYKKSPEGYTLCYEYPDKLDFLHAICPMTIKGIPCVIIGHRGGAKKLYQLFWNSEKKQYQMDVLDENCGPANAFGYHFEGNDILISTNREIDEVAMYQF